MSKLNATAAGVFVVAVIPFTDRLDSTDRLVDKYILAMRGAIASATLRKPAEKLSAADIAATERPLCRQSARLQDIG